MNIIKERRKNKQQSCKGEYDNDNDIGKEEEDDDLMIVTYN